MKRIIDYYNLENLLVKYQETHEDKLTRNEVKLIDSVLFEISTPTKETSSPIEKILAELDGFRMCDQMDYDAYSRLHDLISCLDTQEWIPVSDRLPPEHDTIFAKLKGTRKWKTGMFEKRSEDVRVVFLFEDGTRKVGHTFTIDGVWDCEKPNRYPKRTVTHWCENPSLPEPTQGEL